MITTSKNSLEKIQHLDFSEQIDSKIFVSAKTQYMLAEMKSYFKDDEEQENFRNGHKDIDI